MPIHDVSYDIPDYKEFSDDDIPPDPNLEMPEDEWERLFERLCKLIDSGMYDAEGVSELLYKLIDAATYDPEREDNNPD